MRELRERVAQAAAALAEDGQPPTAERLALQVGAGEASVRHALSARPTFCPVSPSGACLDGKTDREGQSHDQLSVPDDFASAVPEHLVMAEALERLSPTERAVVEHFFYHDLTQREIARALGRSCSNVSRALSRALRKLRTLIARAEQDQARAASGHRAREPVIRPAVVDPETGLFCRAHFRRCLTRELTRGRQDDEPLCLALMTLDAVDGNRSGRTLCWLSAQVRRNTRALDFAFRLGRWRLALLIDEARPQADLVCRRIVSLARRRAHPLAISVGLAEWPRDGRSPAELVLSARRALARVRGVGRAVAERPSSAQFPDAKL